MKVNSVLEGITEYFLKCPLLKDGVFRVDALGPDPVEYTICLLYTSDAADD